MKTTLAAATLVALALLSPPTTAADDTELRLATSVPDGSPWARLLESGARDVREKTGGRVTLRYYWSGAQGDERDAVRKMKLGQLDGAMVSGAGLDMIASDVRVLELPLLFTKNTQLDVLRNTMAADFRSRFDGAGYVLLAWADDGWVHLFSTTPIAAPGDLAKLKMRLGTEDAAMRELFRALRATTVPLGMPEILPALTTGRITACYGTLGEAIARNWSTKTKHATATPVAYAVGALVVRKEVFGRLSRDDQQAVRASGRALQSRLLSSLRGERERVKKALERGGVHFAELPPALASEVQRAAQAARTALTGTVYKDDLVRKVTAPTADAK